VLGKIKTQANRAQNIIKVILRLFYPNSKKWKIVKLYFPDAQNVFMLYFSGEQAGQ
jgi:isocitrate dehydrogenase kinase/phosphatase